ncbi:MAG TPA: 6-phosphogluconolactonase [Oceanobacillus sp.]|nr:6-phosphogluconolactonase [Oceanobacillus sp.]
MAREVRVYQNAGQVNRALAERFASISSKAIAARGRFVVCLAGGNTPRGAYELLTTPEYTALVDWQSAYVFWGDERCVPPESMDSNARMVREALLNHVPVPVNQVHRIRGEIDPIQAAEEYDKTLRDFFRNRMQSGKPRFDLVLLGMGVDGHTASLFPGADALREDKKWAVAHQVKTLNTWRVTLTPAALNAASNVIFLVMGADKADTVKRVLEGEPNPEELPAQIIKPENGNVLWLLDEHAASKLATVKY